MIHSLKAQLNPSDPACVGRRYRSAIPIGCYVTPDEIAAGKPVTVAATHAYGCSIKYKRA